MFPWRKGQKGVKMTKGIITKITPYKSGKGYFIGIEGQPKDFMFFGKINLYVGDSVVYEEGRPSKDGRPTIKTIRADTIEAYVDEDKSRSAPIQKEFRTHDAPKLDSREAYWAAKEKSDAEQKPIITRLSCISSAAQVYSGAQGQDEKVLALAAKFEQFAKGEKVA
jgi:hypothetical protein